jgi:hypothetical protein
MLPTLETKARAVSKDDSIYEWMKQKNLLKHNGEVVDLDRSRWEERKDMTNQRRIDNVAAMLQDKANRLREKGRSQEHIVEVIAMAHDTFAFMLYQAITTHNVSAEAADDERLGRARARAAVMLPGIAVLIDDLNAMCQGARNTLESLGVPVSSFNKVPVE